MIMYQPRLSFLITIALLFVISQANSNNSENNKCRSTCGPSDSSISVPFPFGFSPECLIQLNCSSAGVPLVGEFRVLNTTFSNIIIKIPPKCNRPLSSLSVLFGENYAVSADNTLLLQNCSKAMAPSPCEKSMFPEPSFNVTPCVNKTDDISCFSIGDDDTPFLSSKKVYSTQCRFLVSSISRLVDPEKKTSVSFEMERVNLEWWVKGDCNDQCHNNASCTYVKKGTSNMAGYRCVCHEGFEGDGFKQGGGCRRVTVPGCSGSKLSAKCGKSLRIGLLAGGTFLGFGLFLMLLYKCHKYLVKRSDIKLRKKFFKTNGGILLKQQLSSEQGRIGNTKIFTLKELQIATDHFNESRTLGKGGQGTVFQGNLDGQTVAVKRSRIIDKDQIKEFINEIVILSQINHRNVVKLLGCCLETEVPLLVYEFVSNGTLSQYLHNQCNEFPLTWAMRLRVALEAAGAISYLHSVASTPIYHRDIKSTNILLDEKYTTKVSDFGTAKSIAIDQTHVTTLVYGTIGYLDPEYFETSQFTEKSDVYSFGIVLVELLTGKSPLSLARSSEDRSLATYFVDSMEEDQLFNILDFRIMEDYSCAVEIISVSKLAKSCLSLNRKDRPTMKEVAMELERIQQLQKKINSHRIKLALCSKSPGSQR